MTSDPESNPSVVEAGSNPGQAADRKVGMLGRIGRLAFGLVFQFGTIIVLFIVVHIVRGHYGDSVYSTGQQIVAGVLGFPAAALAIGVLLAAIYTATTGKKGGLTFKLALAAVGLFAVMYAIELALK